MCWSCRRSCTPRIGASCGAAGTPRPDPSRRTEEQGWQELIRGGLLRRPRAPGTGAWFQERLARQMAEGNPWVVGHWRRLAEKHGPAKDAEVDRIEAEQSQMVRVARAAQKLRRLQPDEVRSWTSEPPFPARTTYIPMIGEELARIRGLGEREWIALQDRVLLVVHPERDWDDDNGWLYGFAKLYSALPATPPPDPAVGPEQQGWTELEEGDFLLPWLLHITMHELCERALVVRRSACRSLAAKAGSRLVRSNGVARRMPSVASGPSLK